jgi:hypothetical protein
MTTIHEAKAIPERAANLDDAATGRCAACAHPTDSHDVIATRFCAVTAARALDRGCACRR